MYFYNATVAIKAINPTFKPHTIRPKKKVQQIAVSVFSAAANHIFFCAATVYRLWGGCQVGPRFPVLALFTNHNVFHLPSSLHPHLIAQTVVEQSDIYPLTPLPHTYFLLYALYNPFKQAV